jgi:hypothetical protein
VITFRVDRYRSGSEAIVDVEAHMAGRRVGGAGMVIRQHTLADFSEKIASVSAISVVTKRCGVGTHLYRRLYKIACAENARLASDVKRTSASEGFWRKQERKGRARCLTRKVRGIRLDDRPGIMFQRAGRWPCLRYVMKETCPRRFDLRNG